MKSLKDIKNRIKQFDVNPRSEMRKRVLDEALEIQRNRTRKSTSDTYRLKIIMKSKITKIAAAAVVVLVVVLFVSFLDKSVTPTYALEDTIKANNSLRYVHTEYFEGQRDDVAKECWLEFDESGRTKNLRINWSEWFAGGGVVVWNENETKSWSPKSNTLTIFNDEIYNSRVDEMKESDDPRQIVEQLHDQNAKGLVKIEIDDSGKKEDPIVATVTYLPDSTKRGYRKVLFVDRSTYFTTKMELYVLKEGEYSYYGVIKYFDFNVPIDKRMFNLADEFPKDARIIDKRTMDIGLAQGDLTDEQIAVKVVQQFIKALMAKDYARAGLISGGVLPAEIEKGWGRLKILRLISVDKPVRPEKLDRMLPRALRVPCTIEIEKDGRTINYSRSFYAHTVIGKRQNWQIGSVKRD